MKKTKSGKQRKRTGGTGVFIEEDECPRTVVTYQRMTGSLPKVIVMLRIKFYDVPVVAEEKMLSGQKLGPGIYQLTARFGFTVAVIDAKALLNKAEELGILKWNTKRKPSYYFINQVLENCLKRRVWLSWRLAVYNWMGRALTNQLKLLDVPYDRLVVMGAQLYINSPKKTPKNVVMKFFNK